MSLDSTPDASTLLVFLLLPAVYWLLGRFLLPLARQAIPDERIWVSGLSLLLLGYSPTKPRQIVVPQLLVQIIAWITVIGGVMGTYVFHIPFGFRLAYTYGLGYGSIIVAIVVGAGDLLRGRR